MCAYFGFYCSLFTLYFFIQVKQEQVSKQFICPLSIFLGKKSEYCLLFNRAACLPMVDILFFFICFKICICVGFCLPIRLCSNSFRRVCVLVAEEWNSSFTKKRFPRDRESVWQPNYALRTA